MSNALKPRNAWGRDRRRRLSSINSVARRRVERLARAASVVIRDPGEGLERVREKIADESARWMKSSSLRAEPDWQARLHDLLCVPWPCDVVEAFDPLWRETIAWLERKDLTVGRGSFSGWDDADVAFARAAWCLARHQKPAIVVETGVARGLTTRVVLEALAANGHGRLFSIDLPPPLDERRLAAETAAAVTDGLRGSWTLIEGSSRRRLPVLLRELGTIGLFIHDSRHTRRNISFELKLAWDAIQPGGFLLADDIHGNVAFEECVRSFGGPPSIVCASADERGKFGLIRKSG